MALINFIGREHILYDFYVDFTVSRWLNRPLIYHFGPKNDENQYFRLKWLIFVIFGPEMNVQKSIETHGYREININVIRDVHSTYKVDQNHLESKIWALSRHFKRKYWFSSFFSPKWRSSGLGRHLDAVKLL